MGCGSGIVESSVYAYPVVSGRQYLSCRGEMADPQFPRRLVEFQRRFGSEEACEAYLAELRWRATARHDTVEVTDVSWSVRKDDVTCPADYPRLSRC
jgi:hypothetical protein